jgi:hypothetical protein
MSNHEPDPCGCCDGDDSLTPAELYNRPGLDAINYRIGTHAAFLETMIARLSREEIIEEVITGWDSEGKGITEKRIYRPLSKLTARSGDDFSIALLDAWATIADVLTFYQERIANEGYLRTATERLSILELVRLIGYELKPGVAATTYLAFSVEAAEKLAQIPAGTRAQSVPQPGETMQSFETTEDLEAWAAWNEIKLRTSKPQFINPYSEQDISKLPLYIYLPGVQMGIEGGNHLLLCFNDNKYFRAIVGATDIDNESKYTRIMLNSAWDVSEKRKVQISGAVETRSQPIRKPRGMDWTDQIPLMRKLPSMTLANRAHLLIDEKQLGTKDQDLHLQALSIIEPQVGKVLASVVRSTPAIITNNDVPRLEDIYNRVANAALFGANSPGNPVTIQTPVEQGTSSTTRFDPWKQADIDLLSKLFKAVSNERSDFEEGIFTLEREYNNVQSGMIVLVEWIPDAPIVDESGITAASSQPISSQMGIYRVTGVQTIQANGLGQSCKVTRISVEFMVGDIWHPTPGHLQTTVVSVFNPLSHDPATGLPLANEPIDEPLDATDAAASPSLELDDLYDGLKPGRWLAITGTRSDIPVVARELAMIKNVEHKFAQINDLKLQGDEINPKPNLPGDTRHTFIELATPLSYRYVRETVRINANVARATHGETARGSQLSGGDVVLGSGDAAQPNQRFTLNLQPGSRLTYVPAPTGDGVASTLEVRVNEVRWNAERTLVDAPHDASVYLVMTSDDGKTEVITGDGTEGARIPTGSENVRARYRFGIGKPGNVKAGQISLLATRPPGVKEVTNPLAATGGADPEDRDQARRNAPLSVRTLDRLIGLRDYQDFARTFAGIGKAIAKLDKVRSYNPDGTPIQGKHGNGILVVVAGEENIPLNEGSELIRNLRLALDAHDGSKLPIDVEVYQPRLLYLAVEVQIRAEYSWELVQPHLRAALLDAFSFQRRDLGQDIALSEILAVIYSVPGIKHALVTAFGALTSENIIDLAQGNPVDLAPKSYIDMPDDMLVYADPAVPELIILNEAK